MTQRLVHVIASSEHAGMHIAALRTLPGDYRLTEEMSVADIIAGDAASLHAAVDAGSPAGTLVITDPFAQDWSHVDAVWAAAARTGAHVALANIAAVEIAHHRHLVDAITTAGAPFLAEIRLESLGAQHARLAQAIAILADLGIECPTPELVPTNSGWVAGAAANGITVRVECVNSLALTPGVRVRVTNAATRVTMDVPIVADARPVVSTVATATGTNIVQEAHVSPARAFWLALTATPMQEQA